MNAVMNVHFFLEDRGCLDQLVCFLIKTVQLWIASFQVIMDFFF